MVYPKRKEKEQASNQQPLPVPVVDYNAARENNRNDASKGEVKRKYSNTKTPSNISKKCEEEISIVKKIGQIKPPE